MRSAISSTRAPAYPLRAISRRATSSISALVRSASRRRSSDVGVAGWEDMWLHRGGGSRAVHHPISPPLLVLPAAPTVSACGRAECASGGSTVPLPTTGGWGRACRWRQSAQPREQPAHERGGCGKGGSHGRLGALASPTSCTPRRGAGYGLA